MKRSLAMLQKMNWKGSSYSGSLAQVTVDRENEQQIYLSEFQETKITGLSAEWDWHSELERFVKDPWVDVGVFTDGMTDGICLKETKVKGQDTG